MEELFNDLSDFAYELDLVKAHRIADIITNGMTKLANNFHSVDVENYISELLEDNVKIAADNKGKKLNKPFRTQGGPKKFSVYVKNDKGNVVKVNFGDPGLSIKRDNPNRRKNFRARHNCDNPGPKTKARYWSCRNWEAGRSVSDNLKGK